MRDWLDFGWILFTASAVLLLFGALALLFSSAAVFIWGVMLTLLVLSTLFLVD